MLARMVDDNEPLFAFDPTAMRRLRLDKNILTTEFSKAIGRTTRSVNLYEAGQCPPANTVCRMAHVLGVPLLSLFSPVEPKRRLKRVKT
jgi:transcriptional regulator with XRE-family HTH domain